MTIYDEITIIANQLANQGKKPTVALIKTKLSSPAPLPTIISALKSWTHDPEFISLTNKQEEIVSSQETIASISPEIEAAINNALKPIKAELAEIQVILSKLTAQQS